MWPRQNRSLQLYTHMRQCHQPPAPSFYKLLGDSLIRPCYNSFPFTQVEINCNPRLEKYKTATLLHPYPFQLPTPGRRERRREGKGGGDLIRLLPVEGIEFLGASLIFLIRVSPTSNQQPEASSQQPAAGSRQLAAGSIRGAAASTAPLRALTFIRASYICRNYLQLAKSHPYQSMRQIIVNCCGQFKVASYPIPGLKAKAYSYNMLIELKFSLQSPRKERPIRGVGGRDVRTCVFPYSLWQRTVQLTNVKQ